VTLNQTMISAIASINFISSHKTTPASIEFNILIKKIANTLQMSFDSLDDTQIEKNSLKKPLKMQKKSCLVNTSNYQIYEMKT
jgi:hypothetical protein